MSAFTETAKRAFVCYAQSRKAHTAECEYVAARALLARMEAPRLMITLKTLADFKRFLATPGATVQVVRNDWCDPSKTIHPITPKAGYWEPKHVSKVQSNAVRFTTGSYLPFPKAGHMRFDGDTVSICLQGDGSFRDLLVYRCTQDGNGSEV